MDINGKKISKQKHPNSPPCHMKQIKVGNMACTEPLIICMSGVKVAGMMPVTESMGVGVVPAKVDMDEARW